VPKRGQICLVGYRQVGKGYYFVLARGKSGQLKKSYACWRSRPTAERELLRYKQLYQDEYAQARQLFEAIDKPNPIGLCRMRDDHVCTPITEPLALAGARRPRRRR
jgi:hypothetical protein